MGIANELSSEVAAAVLARRPDAARAEAKELIEIVRDFHSAMRDLESEARSRRASQLTAADSSTTRAASGNH